MGKREELRAYLKKRNCTGVEHRRVKFANGESIPLYQLRSTYRFVSEDEVVAVANNVAGAKGGL